MYIHSSSSIYLRVTSFRACVMVKNCAYLVYPETAITPSVYQGAGGFPLSCLNKRSNSVLWQNGIYYCNRKTQIFLLKYTWISKFWSQVMLIIFKFKHQWPIYWNTCWWGQQTKFPDFSQQNTNFPDLQQNTAFPWLRQTEISLIFPDCGNPELIIRGNLEFIIHVRKRGPWLQYKLVPFLDGS